MRSPRASAATAQSTSKGSVQGTFLPWSDLCVVALVGAAATGAIGKWTRLPVASMDCLARVHLLASDLVFYGALTLVAIVWLAWAPGRAWLACLVASGALGLQGALTWHLILVGEQASWPDVLDAAARRRDLRLVLEEIGAPLMWSGLLLIVAAAGLAWALIRWRSVADALDPQPHRGSSRLGLRYLFPLRGSRFARGVGGLAVGTMMLGSALGFAHRAATPAEAELARNGPLLLLRTFSSGPSSASRIEWRERWAEEESIAELRERRGPNVLLMVLESTGWSATTADDKEAAASAPPSPQHPAKTPQLAELARRGVLVHRARSVLPHTSKALFALHCGRYPAMQVEQWEASPQGDLDCLADVLRRAGYATAFAQSAFGGFEQRPRLVHNFGFEEFFAWEQLRGERLSYFASDDLSLASWFRGWMEERDVGRPFFLTLLTSAPHHAYELPAELSTARPEIGPGRNDAASRHALLLERQDELLGEVLSELRQRGLEEHTVVVVVGDHGEGFGAHGVLQHDNNYYEEGLRVPFVVAGPDVPQGLRLDSEASLLDLLPTLAARLGLRPEVSAGLPGRDLLAERRSPAGSLTGESAPLFFGCHQPSRCGGFVRAQIKVVERRRDRVVFGFDLGRDPDETSPLTLDALRRRLPSFGEDWRAFQRWRQTSRTASSPRFADELQSLYQGWLCDPQGTCRHPSAHRPADRYDPAALP